MPRRLVYFDAIDVIGRLRVADPANVRRIAQSIEEIGLQTPITVMEPQEDGDGFLLVAGLHRLEAMRSLGMESAECEVLDHDPDRAALWEIDENLARAELTDAQRAEHHARRELILIRRGEVKDAPKGGRPRNSEKLSAYSAQAAESLGVDERTIRRDLRRGKNIAPEALAAISGTELDKGVFLDRVVKVPKAGQLAFVQDQLRERQDAEKLNRYADRAVARTKADEAAEIVLADMDLTRVQALKAALNSVTMKDFLAALDRGEAA